MPVFTVTIEDLLKLLSGEKLDVPGGEAWEIYLDPSAVIAAGHMLNTVQHALTSQ